MNITNSPNPNQIDSSFTSIEREKLIEKIRTIEKVSKECEANKKYSDAQNLINEIAIMIKNHISNNKNNLTNDELKNMETLQKSYENKEKSFDYYNFINTKSRLLFQKMTEKYIGSKKTKVLPTVEQGQGETKNPSTEPTSIGGGGNNSNSISGYELVSNSISMIIKEIIEICSGLIKYYEIQFDNKKINMKPAQSEESFYVYDISSNIHLNTSYANSLIEKYISEIKLIKKECERLSEVNFEYDISKINQLEEEISIIRVEFNKIYPKFVNLRNILEKHNLVRGSDKK